jgi:amphi-Trp domain-containing protein
MISIESEYRATRQDVAALLESLAEGLRSGRVVVGARAVEVGGELSVDAELSPSTGILRITVDLDTREQ